MKLPNAALAIVAKEKIARYLLVPEHPQNGGKAAFFFHFGFRHEAWEEMVGALRAHTQYDVAEVINASFGVVYCRGDAAYSKRANACGPFGMAD